MTEDSAKGEVVSGDGGWADLEEGSRHYIEGMKCQASEERDQRIAHFKEAEHQYLLSTMQGNAIAYLNLGYVYSYDRCEGSYEIATRDDLGPIFLGSAYLTNHSNRLWRPTRDQLDSAAYYCFCWAAADGEPEAMYKQGDMELVGRGCDQHERHARDLFEEAFETSKEGEPVIWGSAALRLGSCYEHGEGCECHFTKALEWYEIAETGLQAAVNAGDWFYERALKRASDGAKRMRQELSGKY